MPISFFPDPFLLTAAHHIYFAHQTLVTILPLLAASSLADYPINLECKDARVRIPLEEENFLFI
jgi:hypothetical protein